MNSSIKEVLAKLGLLEKRIGSLRDENKELMKIKELMLEDIVLRLTKLENEMNFLKQENVELRNSFLPTTTDGENATTSSWNNADENKLQEEHTCKLVAVDPTNDTKITYIIHPDFKRGAICYNTEEESDTEEYDTEEELKERNWKKPIRISDELAIFLEKSSGSKMARHEVTNEINKYIRGKKLIDPKNSRKIIPDAKLTALLKLSNDDELNYFNLQQFLTPHYDKKKF